METSEETLPALAKEQIVVTKDTRVPLIGLQLIMVALLCVIAFKEQSAPQLCKKVSIWVNACLIKLSIMVALQILQVQNESKTPRDPESVSKDLTSFLLKLGMCFLAIVGIVGLSISTNCSQCAIVRPTLWWSAFSLSLLIVVVALVQGSTFISHLGSVAKKRAYDYDDLNFCNTWIDDDLEYNSPSAQEVSLPGFCDY